MSIINGMNKQNGNYATNLSQADGENGWKDELVFPLCCRVAVYYVNIVVKITSV